VNVGLLTLILFASVLILLGTGFPVAFAIGGASVIFALLYWGSSHLYILASSAYSYLQDTNLVAIPLFVLMGWLLEKSGIADDVFEAVYVWLGPFPGGLAIGTIIIGALFGAMCGELVAAIVTLSTMALRPMLRRGYDKHLAIGTIMAAALLGLIIPPSIEIIVYSSVTGESLGRMYLAAFVPGLVLAGLYITYIAVRCHLRPDLGPPAPPETRVGWGERTAKLKGVAAPLILLVAIVGGIYSGAITPMEASAVGATGAFVCAAVKRRLNWGVLKETVFATLRISSMIAWLLIGVGMFSAVYSGLGARQLAQEVVAWMPGGGWVLIFVTQLTLLVAGCFMDDFAVIMILGPIFVTAIKSLGFNSLWYGILFMLNIQVAFLSPPYGFAVFCMKGTVPKDSGITMGDIYRSAFPFLGVQLVCLVLVMIFKPLTTWLPGLVIR
jgi:tripartite ATP-independent transporter DctM subunit